MLFVWTEQYFCFSLFQNSSPWLYTSHPENEDQQTLGCRVCTMFDPLLCHTTTKWKLGYPVIHYKSHLRRVGRGVLVNEYSQKLLNQKILQSNISYCIKVHLQAKIHVLINKRSRQNVCEPNGVSIKFFHLSLRSDHQHRGKFLAIKVHCHFVLKKLCAMLH